jgi:hypothetical protein
VGRPGVRWRSSAILNLMDRWSKTSDTRAAIFGDLGLDCRRQPRAGAWNRREQRRSMISERPPSPCQFIAQLLLFLLAKLQWFENDDKPLQRTCEPERHLSVYFSSTGVPVSSPTSKVSSKENRAAIVCGIRTWPTSFSSTSSAAVAPLPIPPPSYAKRTRMIWSPAGRGRSEATRALWSGWFESA